MKAKIHLLWRFAPVKADRTMLLLLLIPKIGKVVKILQLLNLY